MDRDPTAAIRVHLLPYAQFHETSQPVTYMPVHLAKAARIFYRQSRDINHFLQSNNSVSRTNYIRILALASIDVLLSLPFGIVNVILYVTGQLSYARLPFYFGWTYDHTDWEPVRISYAELLATGVSSVVRSYVIQWTSPVLAFAIFGLFGVTLEARASYWRAICTVGGCFGWEPTPRTCKARLPLGDIEFGERPQATSFDLEIVCVSCLSMWAGLNGDN